MPYGTSATTGDNAGNRVKKSYIKASFWPGTSTITGIKKRNDYYVHDAQGNILAIYHEFTKS